MQVEDTVDGMERRAGDSQAWLPGRAIAPGVAFGYARFEEAVPAENVPSAIEPGAVQNELMRLDAAFGQVRDDLETHINESHAPDEEDHQHILNAHLAVLDDAHFFSSIRDRIETGHVSAERAVREVFLAVARRLTAHGNSYMHDRVEDFRDICQNLRRALLHGVRARQPRQPGTEPFVCLTPHLHPTAVLRAKRLRAVAFVTASRAFTSHGAILLQGSGIPALGGVAFAGAGVKVGAMIEVPSAALGVSEILPMVDFVSIGTNDLLQYLTASDRDNVAVIDYQRPESAGIFAVVRHVMDAARSAGMERDVTVCGELASDPDAARALAGIGITSLSIAPNTAPMVREAMESPGPAQALQNDEMVLPVAPGSERGFADR